MHYYTYICFNRAKGISCVKGGVVYYNPIIEIIELLHIVSFYKYSILYLDDAVIILYEYLGNVNFVDLKWTHNKSIYREWCWSYNIFTMFLWLI